MLCIFVVNGLLLLIASKFQPHDLQLKVVFIILQCHSFVELLLCCLSLLLVFLLQFLIALLVNLGFDKFVSVTGVYHTEFRQISFNIRRRHISLPQIRWRFWPVIYAKIPLILVSCRILQSVVI